MVSGAICDDGRDCAHRYVKTTVNEGRCEKCGSATPLSRHNWQSGPGGIQKCRECHALLGLALL